MANKKKIVMKNDGGGSSTPTGHAAGPSLTASLSEEQLAERSSNIVKERNKANKIRPALLEAKKKQDKEKIRKINEEDHTGGEGQIKAIEENRAMNGEEYLQYLKNKLEKIKAEGPRGKVRAIWLEGYIEEYTKNPITEEEYRKKQMENS